MKNKLIAVFTIIGSLFMIIGTFLPWITSFAGLVTYSGITGLYGKMLLGIGIFILIIGLVFLRLPKSQLRWGIGFLGFASMAFCSWLLIGLVKTYQQISTDSMIVGGVGPGLFVVTIGTILIFSTFFFKPKTKAGK